MSKKSECDEMSNFKIIHNIEEHQTNIDLIYNLRKLSEKKQKQSGTHPLPLQYLHGSDVIALQVFVHLGSQFLTSAQCPLTSCSERR